MFAALEELILEMCRLTPQEDSAMGRYIDSITPPLLQRAVVALTNCDDERAETELQPTDCHRY